MVGGSRGQLRFEVVVRSWGRLGWLGACLAAVLVVWPAIALSPTAPAAVAVPAHSRLLSVSPVDGAMLTQPPAQIVLAFNEEVNPSFVTVALSSGGASIPLGAPVVTGGTVTTPVPAGMGAGAARIAYRVVSKDGHPISGTSGFTVSAATSTIGVTPATTPNTPAPAAGSSVPSPTAGSPAATTVALDPASVGSSGAVVPVIGGVVAVLLVGAGGLLVWWRRRHAD